MKKLSDLNEVSFALTQYFEASPELIPARILFLSNQITSGEISCLRQNSTNK
jgi:hypothetical protein